MDKRSGFFLEFFKLRELLLEQFLVDDVPDGFVLAADGDGEVEFVSGEECEVDVEVLSQFGLAEEVGVQEVLVVVVGGVAHQFGMGDLLVDGDDVAEGAEWGEGYRFSLWGMVVS
jgi:hypothetical protein